MSKRRAATHRNGSARKRNESPRPPLVRDESAAPVVLSAASTVLAIAEDCVICCGALEAVRGKLPCAHTFCCSCIETWSKVNNSCPLCKAVFHSIDVVEQEGVVKKRSVHVKDVVPECEYGVADYPEEHYGDARMYLQVHQEVNDFIRGVNFIGFGLSRYNEELDEDYEVDMDDDDDDDDDDDGDDDVLIVGDDSRRVKRPASVVRDEDDDDDDDDDGIFVDVEGDPFEDPGPVLRAPAARGRPVPLRRSHRLHAPPPPVRRRATASRPVPSRRAPRRLDGRATRRRNSGAAAPPPPPPPPPRIIDLVEQDDDEPDSDYCDDA